METYYQTREHRLERCDATTGHSVHPIAYCDTAERADFLLQAITAQSLLVASLKECADRVRLEAARTGSDFCAGIFERAQAALEAAGK